MREMRMKKKLYYFFKKYFEEEMQDDTYNQIEELNSERYIEFVNAFQNKYIINNERDIYFRRTFLRKYAQYLFMDNINSCLSTNSVENCINIAEMEDTIFDRVNQNISLDSRTVFITQPWKGANLTGNTNAYRGVVYNGFVHDTNNVKGVYIKDIDLAFIYNGNHSVSIGSIVDDINITSNTNEFKTVKLNNAFFNSKIEYNKIVLNNNKIVNISSWKLSVLFKIIQLLYR
jgi:hypothetical protein